MTYWIRPLHHHLQLGTTDGPIANPYPEESYAGSMWRAGNAFHNGSPDDAFPALARAGMILTKTAKRMPSIETLVDKIGVPTDQWVGNCAAISTAVLPHLDLDLALTAYGFYTGPVAPGSHFAKAPIVRHGWIETLDGLVIDPTRWVFENTEPQLYVGSITDYDYGMMRYKAETPFPEPSESSSVVRFEDEQVEYITALTGLAPDGNSFTLAANQSSWLADRPMEVMREHFIPVLDALEAADAGWIGLDARNWRDTNRPIMDEQAAAAA